MSSPIFHEWNISPKEAIAIQKDLRAQLSQTPLDIDRVKTVAGVDVAGARRYSKVFAAVAVMSFPDMDLVEERVVRTETSFPYIPGLLTFREGPSVIRAFDAVESRVDVTLFDGQGIAHPRGFGLASHLGLLLGIPSVGCAKTRLIGEFEEPGRARGSTSPLLHEGRVVGSVVRTRDGVAPVFVSIGNAVDLDGAVKLVLACAKRYRLPEPARQAHRLASEARRAYENVHGS